MKSGVNPATWMLEVTGGAVSVSAKAVEVSGRGTLLARGVGGRSPHSMPLPYLAPSPTCRPIGQTCARPWLCY